MTRLKSDKNWAMYITYEYHTYCTVYAPMKKIDVYVVYHSINYNLELRANPFDTEHFQVEEAFSKMR